MATLDVCVFFFSFFYLTRSAGKNLEACPVSSMLLIKFFNLSSDVEKSPISIHGLPFRFMSTASGEREDALPQAPERTNSTGLFKEAAGMNQCKHTLKTHLLMAFTLRTGQRSRPP